MKRLVVLCFLAITASIAARADNFLYGDNATGGVPYVYKIDKTTGAVVDTYTNLSSINGRGVVVVGDTMYYTSASSGSIFSYTLSTHTNHGALFSVAGASALSTIAYDGTNFIIGDYSGTNKVYFYTPTGTLLNTVSLSNCGGNCDGLEYFQKAGVGYLIENRGDTDGPYDVYTLGGTLVTSGLIAPGTSTTGIAFDGTNFFTSEIFAGKLEVWSPTGTLVNTLTLTGFPSGFSPLIEDLSADYSTVLPPSTVPEPGSLLLVGTGMLGAAATMRRRLAGMFSGLKTKL